MCIVFPAAAPMGSIYIPILSGHHPTNQGGHKVTQGPHGTNSTLLDINYPTRQMARTSATTTRRRLDSRTTGDRGEWISTLASMSEDEDCMSTGRSQSPVLSRSTLRANSLCFCGGLRMEGGHTSCRHAVRTWISAQEGESGGLEPGARPSKVWKLGDHSPRHPGTAHWQPFEDSCPVCPTSSPSRDYVPRLLWPYSHGKESQGSDGSGSNGWSDILEGKYDKVVGRLPGGEEGGHRRVRWADRPSSPSPLARSLSSTSRDQGRIDPPERGSILDYF